MKKYHIPSFFPSIYVAAGIVSIATIIWSGFYVWNTFTEALSETKEVKTLRIYIVPETLNRNMWDKVIRALEEKNNIDIASLPLQDPFSKTP